MSVYSDVQVPDRCRGSFLGRVPVESLDYHVCSHSTTLSRVKRNSSLWVLSPGGSGPLRIPGESPYTRLFRFWSLIGFLIRFSTRYSTLTRGGRTGTSGKRYIFSSCRVSPQEISSRWVTYQESGRRSRSAPSNYLYVWESGVLSGVGVFLSLHLRSLTQNCSERLKTTYDFKLWVTRLFRTPSYGHRGVGVGEKGPVSVIPNMYKKERTSEYSVQGTCRKG